MAKNNPQPYDEDDAEGPQSTCKDCRYFDADRDSVRPSDDVLCMCIHPDLEEYELFVSGDSGCSLFEAFQEEEAEFGGDVDDD